MKLRDHETKGNSQFKHKIQGYFVFKMRGGNKDFVNRYMKRRSKLFLSFIMKEIKNISPLFFYIYTTRP